MIANWPSSSFYQTMWKAYKKHFIKYLPIQFTPQTVVIGNTLSTASSKTGVVQDLLLLFWCLVLILNSYRMFRQEEGKKKNNLERAWSIRILSVFRCLLIDLSIAILFTWYMYITGHVVTLSHYCHYYKHAWHFLTYIFLTHHRNYK